MTIGATTTFTETRDEILTDALTNLGAVSPERSVSEARTAGLLTHAARALDRLVKSLDAEGQFLWRIVRRTASLDSDHTFVPLADVLDLDEPLSVFSDAGLGSDRQLMRSMPRDEYMNLPRSDAGVPTATGLPSRYYVERSLSGLTVYLDSVFSGDFQIEYPAYIRGADFVSGSNTPDFDQKWVACLVYGLTMELAAAYGQPALISVYRDLFEGEKKKLLKDDTERGPLTLVPFGRGVW